MLGAMNVASLVSYSSARPGGWYDIATLIISYDETRGWGDHVNPYDSVFDTVELPES